MNNTLGPGRPDTMKIFHKLNFSFWRQPGISKYGFFSKPAVPPGIALPRFRPYLQDKGQNPRLSGPKKLRRQKWAIPTTRRLLRRPIEVSALPFPRDIAGCGKNKNKTTSGYAAGLPLRACQVSIRVSWLTCIGVNA